MASDHHRKALIVVDMQPDFMDGGPLEARGGSELVAPIAQLMTEGHHDLIVATQDWHPPGHVSFARQHNGANPFDVITLYGHDQVLWPDHCVQGSRGAALHVDMPWERANVIIRKGEDPAVDSYSGFRNNWNAAGERPPTGLAGYLRERGVEAVEVCGLARDFCVYWTAEDAAAEGFSTTVLWGLTRPVDAASDDAVREALGQAGVRVEEGV